MNKKLGLDIWMWVFLCLFSVSCSDSNSDPTDGDGGEKGTELDINHWIEDIMRSDYLWYNEIPAARKLDYTTDPETFFQSLLSLKDGKTVNGKHQYYYSYMKKNKNYNTRTSIDTDDTYGMEFTLFNITDKNSNPLGYYYARILYVLPNSPAETAGLKRGDWITGINGKNNIKTESNYKALINGSSAQWTISEDDMSTFKTVNIEASRAVEDNPLFYHSVIPAGGDKKVGYLVYNHFSSGPTGASDRKYDEEMMSIFLDFQSKGVNEFVLDLRYNGGGYAHSANVLAGLLIPAASKDKVFAVFRNNKDKVIYNRLFNTETKEHTGKLQLNSNRIYILTSQSTASSSEVVINGLKPFMDVVLIGELTEGKNVGMQEYSDNKYEWAYLPLTVKVTNSTNFDYSSGFEPKIEWNEFDLSQNTDGTLLPLGDRNEFMLSKALELISGVNRKTTRSVANSSTKSILRGAPIYQSIERHATGGVLLCPNTK